MPAYSLKRQDAMARLPEANTRKHDVGLAVPLTMETWNAAIQPDPGAILLPRPNRDRLGGIAMRISFDTQEDTYEDALAVLRRAYGRRGPARKRDESQAGAEPEKPAAEKKAASRKRNKSAGTRPSETRKAVTSTGAGSARGEISAPPMRRPRSTSESATGKVGTMRGTARPRRVTRKKTSAGAAANVAPPGQSEAVRAWARAQGMPVSDRGRMPASVIAAYEAAHNG